MIFWEQKQLNESMMNDDYIANTKSERLKQQWMWIDDNPILLYMNEQNIHATYMKMYLIALNEQWNGLKKLEKVLILNLYNNG